MIVLGNTGGTCIVTRGYGCPTTRRLLEKAFEFLSKVDPILLLFSPATASQFVLSFAAVSAAFMAMTEKAFTFESLATVEAIVDSPVTKVIELESPVDLEVIILSFDP
jgi:hypothetical protein